MGTNGQESNLESKTPNSQRPKETVSVMFVGTSDPDSEGGTVRVLHPRQPLSPAPSRVRNPREC